MTYALNETHDPQLQSWLASANVMETDFPLQNLPFGAFRRAHSREAFRIGVAIGDQAFDIAAAQYAGLFSGPAADAAACCTSTHLNALMQAGPSAASALRAALSRLLRAGSAAELRARDCLVPLTASESTLPAAVGDYTDFFASIYHATNAGSLFRPDQPLLPNYKYVPVAYHSRASSLRASGHSLVRPLGQTKAAHAGAPDFGPSQRLDFELEIGFFIGSGNALGAPVPVADAERHVFGVCLLNDWSARDIQAWEYQPLGPFLGKSFGTTISPWVVTLEALAPFRVPALTRPAGDPQPLPHLYSEADRESGGIDIALEVFLSTAKMRAAHSTSARLSQSSFRHSYWTLAQMVAHHTSNGCDLRPGDLLASGTMSGPGPAELGSLLEITRNGTQPLKLPNGETRTFLEDGDTVLLRGHCEKHGARRIGFGECAGTIVPARHRT